jgi:hypothetical protein
MNPLLALALLALARGSSIRSRIVARGKANYDNLPERISDSKKTIS